MDNLTHTLTGLLLARAGFHRGSRQATAVLVIGSNLPDVDSLAGLYGSLYYLEHHRGLTHSIAGLGILSPLLAGLAFLAARRRSPEGAPARPLRLLGLSLLAQAVHLAMDFLNSYGVRPLLPWNGRWFYGDLAFIIDPWMWLLAGGALFVSWPGPRRAGPGWTLLGLATGLIVLSGVAGAVDSDLGLPRILPPIWFASIGGALVFRSRLLSAARGGPGRFRWRKLAEPALACRLSLGALGVYGLLLALGHDRALARIEREAEALIDPVRVRTIAALPTPAHPFRWVGFVETPDLLFIKRGATWTSVPRRLDEPAVRAVRAHCAGAALFRFYRFPVADVEPNGDGFDVVLRDARYRRAGRSGFGAAGLTLASDLSVLNQSRCPPPAEWGDRRGVLFSYCFERGPEGRIGR